MSDLTEYIAATIAEARAKKVRERLRPRLLQTAQLADGRLIEDDEGVTAAWERCPACIEGTADMEGTRFIVVPGPFGIEASEMAQPSEVRRDKIPDDVLIWAINNGIFKLSVDNKTFDAFSHSMGDEPRENMAVIGGAIRARKTDVLRVIPPEKVKGLQ